MGIFDWIIVGLGLATLTIAIMALIKKPKTNTPAPVTPATSNIWKNWRYIVIPIGLAVVAIVVIIPFSFWPAVFSNSLLMKPAVALICALVVFSLMADWDEKVAKKWIKFSAFVLVLVAVTVSLSQTTNKKSTQDKVKKVIDKVSAMVEPKPEPDEKWTHYKIVTVPVAKSWDQAAQVELNDLNSRWFIHSLPPDPYGRWEMMVKGWTAPYKGGGPYATSQNRSAPNLPRSGKFMIRSLEGKPIQVKIDWR